MFKEKTVIVLGAGASMPYGFPSGNGLIDEVVRHGLAQGFFDALIQRSNGRMDDAVRENAEEFLKRLSEAHPSSIDSWLYRRGGTYDIVGRIAIAYHLMRFENHDLLMSRHFDTPQRRDEMWYPTFLNMLGETKDEVLANSENLSIVTFNYDRSLEHFAHTKFLADFSVDEWDAAMMADSLNIRHIYGALGTLPWQARHIRRFTSAEFIRDYKSDYHPQDAVVAAKQIKLIHDVETGSGEEIQQIKESILNASYVFLVGFGFHDKNCDVLGLDQTNAEIYSTCRGLSERMKKRIKSRFRRIKLDCDSAGRMVYDYEPFAAVASGQSGRKVVRRSLSELAHQKKSQRETASFRSMR